MGDDRRKIIRKLGKVSPAYRIEKENVDKYRIRSEN